MAKLRRSRAKRLVLDIGSSAIRLCELSQTKAGYQLTKYYQREFLNDPALDEDERKDRRRAALVSLLKEAKIRTRKTIIGVPGRSVFTRKRTLPPVPEYKVTQIVRYEIQQQIPFALDQIALDYQILSRTDAGGYDVMMAAIKVDVVDKHVDILHDVKCSIDTVDVGPLAAYNWLKHNGEFGDGSQCVALLDIGASTTDIVIERNGQFHFTRPLNIGGDDITRAITAAFGLNFEDAEKLKRERAFAPTGDPNRDGKAGEVIGQPLARLVSEVNRSFGYFRSLPGGGTVDRVVVTGGGACLRNIIPYLQRELNTEVRIAQPLSGLAVGPAAQEANEYPEQAAVVLGMALRTCEQATIEINLIPPKVLEAARRREQVFYWILSLITLALIGASIIPARAQKDKAVLQEIETYKGLIRAYDPEMVDGVTERSHFAKELGAAEGTAKQQLRELKALTQAYKGRTFWLVPLDTINGLRPEGGKIWISSFQTSVVTEGGQRGSSGGAGAGGLGGFGGGLRGTGGRLGISSTGFPGLSPGNLGSSLGASGGGMRGFGMRSGGMRGPGGDGGNEFGAKAPPKPNGYTLIGYAKDPASLTEFIDRLREHPLFNNPQKGKKVHFDEANVTEVPITELWQAQVASTGSMGGGLRGGGLTGGGLTGGGTRGGTRGGGFGGGGFGGGGFG
ncbi:MAG: type IV pilus assembly protein PilM, partial [Nitrospiraceae bacterium]|nr:type IV pilus assembly protein PilM [Nitrospiraceae bacterium]